MNQASHKSSRISRALFAWVVMRRQKLRRLARGSSAPLVIPAPVIIQGILVVSEVNPTWLDAIVDFSFDGAGLPAGALEVQGSLSSDYGNWQPRLVVPVGAAQFRDDMVFTNQDNVYYRMRFVSGDIIGPFSDEYLLRL
jgi:hypothetical protein